MKRWLLQAALAGLLVAVPLRAEDKPPVTALPDVSAAPLAPVAPGCAPGGCAAPGHARVLAAPRMELVPRDTETVLPRWKVQSILTPAFILVPKVEPKTAKRTVIVTEVAPRTEKREVMSYEARQVPKCDPHTGHTCMVTEMVPVPKVVEVTVYDTKQVPREIEVLTPVVTYVPREVAVETLQVLPLSVPAICRRLELAVAPNEVPVPACLPVPPPPPPVCPVEVGIVKPPPIPGPPCCGPK
jgi:hypothetical protein